jgi:hypothetical protein
MPCFWLGTTNRMARGRGVRSIIAVIFRVAKQPGDSALDDPALLAEGGAGFDAFAHDRGAIPR